ncbi:hypothetical protein GGS24DRAFT_378141 [Hypoxylon argillaceum]|nr:hypothetical protein GGS24DRAFT_378141 [Hypoxylon argillaceum]
MASPVKTAPPTALDRGDRFGHDGALSTSGLPMPGLSGRANSPTVGHQQATSSRAPSMTTASSRTPPSWLASSSTSRPRSTSRHASAATSSWGFTRCGGSGQQHGQSCAAPAALSDADNHNAPLITGLFFLGGSKSDDGSEFRYDNFRVHLQTSSQGFVLGAGRESVSLLRITMRFTMDFMDGDGLGLNAGNDGTEMKGDQNSNQRDLGMNNKGMEDQKNRAGGHEAQHSLSLSLTMTMTIVAVNTTTLS